MSANSRPRSLKRLATLGSLALVTALSITTAGSQLQANSSREYLVAQNIRNTIAVELETQNDGFSTLSAALKATGLNRDLSGRGPFTIFAPTDEAFAALPPGTVQSLLRPENRHKLVKILTYHVVPGEVSSFDARSGQPRTLSGDPVRLQVSRGGADIRVNSAQVIVADIPARNGVIHAIDQVLIPPGL